ncbi:hypothetical protein [Marilutibacter maris]|uniref:hypothetical protein n=1 Tax=Marilutibacter maris TaxID=1605891 RepID=UPI0011AE9D9A|nr:hypothetical protein [Lysobacter maris]
MSKVGSQMAYRSFRLAAGVLGKVRTSVWIFALGCFLSCLAFVARPNVWSQLMSMLFSLTALPWLAMLVIQGAIRWRERAVGNLVSCLLIVASFQFAISCGHVVRDAVFRFQSDRWNRAVTWVVRHNAPNGGRPIALPDEYSDLAYGVHYRHDEACGLMVDFFWGGGFPVKHTVRRYALNPDWVDIGQCRKSWSRGRALSGSWYEVSD